MRRKKLSNKTQHKEEYVRHVKGNVWNVKKTEETKESEDSMLSVPHLAFAHLWFLFYVQKFVSETI